VTAVVIDRDHIEDLVMAKPLLLQELGRIIDQRRRPHQTGAVSPDLPFADTLGR